MKDSDYKCSLGKTALTKAKKELKEDPDTRLVEVQNLRKRIVEIPGLKPKTDILTLLGFLRARKFDQERTFQLIKDHYEVRKDTEFFADLKPSKVKHVFDTKIVEVLEERDNDGCRVVIFRTCNWDVDAFPVTDLMKAFFITLCYLAREEETQVSGIHMIEKLEGISWRQATAVTPSMSKKFLHMIQDAMPLRLTKLDMTHEPTFFDVVFAIVKPFMKKKLLDRLTLNGSNFDRLHESVNPCYLPTDLGGKLEPHSNQKFFAELLAADSSFEEENKFGFMNMSISEDNDKKNADAGMAGLGGTFKKLDI